jgi:hypothetical protein
MQYFIPAFIISSIVLTPYFIEQSWQVEEKMFFGKSTLKIPASIPTQEKNKFSIDLLYQKGPYTITDLNATIDVYPQSAAPFVSVEITPLHTSLITTYSTTFSGKITVDNEIPVDQIFLSVYYTGKDVRGTSYKSAWVDRSDPIKIDKVSTPAETCEGSLGSQKGQSIDLEYDIDGAKVLLICRSEFTNSVTAKIDAQSAGTLKIRIPKQVVYSLASADCKSSDLLILMDKEEILPAGSIHTNKDNVITVAFSKGIHIIEFVGFTIIPDPAPYQYCGIVMGFDSLYLPPKFQTERGMKTEQVRCNEGLSLLKKASNDNSICVSFKTGQKLLERNLAYTIARTGVIDFDNESAYGKEITILSISPKNVTLPESKNQTYKTTCNADGVCFTPE